MTTSGPEAKVLAKMRKAGADVYGDRLVIVKYHGDQYAKAGVSDLLCCLDGVFVAVEVKAPKYEADPAKAGTVLQRAFVAHVIEAGGVGGFAASVLQFMDLLDEAVSQVRM